MEENSLVENSVFLLKKHKPNDFDRSDYIFNLEN